MENIFSRIKKVIDFKGISNNEFGRNIGCSSAQIVQMLTHEKNFGIDKLLKILSVYPEISAEWLIVGNGEMLKNGNSIKAENINKSDVLQENSYINTLLSRLEKQSEKIGQLKLENARLNKELERANIEIACMEVQLDAQSEQPLQKNKEVPAQRSTTIYAEKFLV